MGGNKCPFLTSSSKYSGKMTCDEDCIMRCEFEDGSEGCSLSAQGQAASMIAAGEVIIELIREAIDGMFGGERSD